MKQKKEHYVSPQIEVIHLENEGVIADSSGVSDMQNNQWNGRSARMNNRNSASFSEVEDMINDILTVGE